MCVEWFSQPFVLYLSLSIEDTLQITEYELSRFFFFHELKSACLC